MSHELWMEEILHHLGWLKPFLNNGMFTTYQLVQDFFHLASLTGYPNQVSFPPGHLHLADSVHSVLSLLRLGSEQLSTEELRTHGNNVEALSIPSDLHVFSLPYFGGYYVQYGFIMTYMVLRICTD